MTLICLSEGCGKSVKRKGDTGPQPRYCCRKCRDNSNGKNRTDWREKQCSTLACIEPVHSRGLCSIHYRAAWQLGGIPISAATAARRQAIRSAVRAGCKICKTEVLKPGRAFYCSTDCAREGAKKRLKARKSQTAERRSHSRVRAAREKATAVTPISRREVFERDDWTCYLCLTPTLRLGASDYDWRHPKAPTVDHEIPLAKGGPHIMDNLLTAHRGCNMRKGTRPWFQCMELLQ